jgi:hypothetical protein
MLSLKATQDNIVATINTGPGALNLGIFSGTTDRIMLGLKAHANTISHARLIALEDSFPLTRDALGDALFNGLSRQYVETVLTGAFDNNRIGSRFAAFLASSDVDVSVSELAQIEWAYLESYHARDAAPLQLADLAILNEADLLTLPVALHPSARILELSAPISWSLTELAGQTPRALLLIRPQAEVRLHPLDAAQQTILAAAVPAPSEKNVTLGNLLAIALEHSDAAPLEPVHHLIEAGALIATG